VRAGYVRNLLLEFYSYLFLGQRSIQKIMAIVREEMDVSARNSTSRLNPREIWEASGRWSVMATTCSG